MQALVAALLYCVLRMLPMMWASNLVSSVTRVIGPALPISNRARSNIARAMPELSPVKVEAIVQEMWENLGRTIGEFPHVHSIDVYDPNGPITATGTEWVDMLREDGKPGFFFSGHIGNWELLPLVTSQRGVPIDVIYRQPNNYFVEWLYRLGHSTGKGQLIPKGPKGVPLLIKAVRTGRHIGVLVDQKMNDGISVPFFGIEAKTAPAIAQLAIKHDCPLVPVRLIRLKGATFQLEVFPPVELANTGDRNTDIVETMRRVNTIIEGWIREYPGQWLWLHNRWPDN